MSENENQVEAALGGVKPDAAGTAGDIERELEKSRHTNEVMAGRLKAQGEELKQLREELRKLSAERAAGEVVDGRGVPCGPSSRAAGTSPSPQS